MLVSLLVVSVSLLSSPVSLFTTHTLARSLREFTSTLMNQTWVGVAFAIAPWSPNVSRALMGTVMLTLALVLNLRLALTLVLLDLAVDIFRSFALTLSLTLTLTLVRALTHVDNGNL